MTATAADALRRLWDRRVFDIDEATPRGFDRLALFGRIAPLVVEIGCGMGDATLAMADADPMRDYLGIDVHTPGLGALLARAEASGVANLAVARGDGVEFLRHGVTSESLDAIHGFFPDPWPKARHHKRRIVRPEIVTLMSDRLRPGGTLHTSTDWAPYADQMLAVLSADPLLHNMFDGFAPRPDGRPFGRPLTKFECRGIAAGRTILDCVFTRVAAA